MNLDELHKVMKGDMTIDQACEGMTDDFEIGHVSHRKDGDYRKVAQGQWKKVTAKEFMDKARSESAAGWKADIEKKKEQIKSMEKRRDDHPENAKGWQEEIDRTNKEIGEIEKRIANASEKPAEQQGGGDTGAKPASGIEAWKKDEGVAGRDLYTSPDGQHKIRVNRNYLAGRRTFSLGTKENGKWENKGEFDTIEEAVAAAKPAEQKGGGENTELSISEETGRDKFMDKLTTFSEKYNDPSKVTVWKTEKGNWDAYYDGHRLGIIGGDQINDDLAKKLGWYQGDYSQDSAPPRLTRDTKIRLSRIKREVTQDKTYNVGETSQRKDGLYKKIAPGKWAPVKAGGSAGAPAGTKKTYEGSGSTKGHKWEAEKVGDKYISTHTWPDGRTDKTEITQKDYETMRTTQGGKSEAPKKPHYDLKSNGVTEQDIMKNIREDEPDFDWGPLYRSGGIDAVLNEYEAMGNDPTALMYSNKK